MIKTFNTITSLALFNSDSIITFLLLFSLPFLMGAENIADPTRPPGFVLNPNATISSKGQLELTAVFIYPNYRLAIINSQPVLVGDQIGGFTITSISPYTVELIGPQNTKEVLQLTVQVKQQK